MSKQYKDFTRKLYKSKAHKIAQEEDKLRHLVEAHKREEEEA